VVNPELAAAYAACEQLARSHYENFPVASYLLPAKMRPHVAAVYAFARLADDMADEGTRPAAERLADLDRWGARLDAALDGGAADREPNAFVFVAVRHSIETCRLPRALFHDLLSAFRQDVTVTRYASWESLLDYCRRSANPVGRLVLRIAGHGLLVSPSGLTEADAASDAVCTALQLTNFWQDLEVDWMKGRLYVPESIWRAAGASDTDLTSRRLTREWRAALQDVAGRTRALFAEGRPVCAAVSGRLRYQLRATWLGGTRILDKLETADFDVFAHRPTLTKADLPWLLWRTLSWRVEERASAADELREGSAPGLKTQPTTEASRARAASELREGSAPGLKTRTTTEASRASAASEPRERSAPAERRARERAGESEGQSPSDE
jgi:hydroxysqualene synthase